MLKWVTSWVEARAFQDSVRTTTNGIIWAVKMPKTYPECRVTRQGIAYIAITDDETLVRELSDDGGEALIMP